MPFRYIFSLSFHQVSLDALSESLHNRAYIHNSVLQEGGWITQLCPNIFGGRNLTAVTILDKTIHEIILNVRI